MDASTGFDPGGGGRDGRARADLVDAVKKGGAAGASLEDLKKSVGNQLAPKYEAGMSKYPLGQYRDRVGVNVEHVYNKLVKKG